MYIRRQVRVIVYGLQLPNELNQELGYLYTLHKKFELFFRWNIWKFNQNFIQKRD